MKMGYFQLNETPSITSFSVLFSLDGKYIKRKVKKSYQIL